MISMRLTCDKAVQRIVLAIGSFFQKHAFARTFAIACFWLSVWQGLSLAVNNVVMLCGPADALCALARLVVTASFWGAVAATLGSVVLGFFLALAAGVLGGFLSWKFNLFCQLVDPLVHFVKSVPVACFIVLFLVLLGSRCTVVVCAALVCAPPLYAATKEGLVRCAREKQELFEVFGIKGLRALFALWLPAVLPFLYAACTTAVGMAWKSGVAAELIGIPLETVGAAVYQAKITLATDELFAWTFTVIACSFLCEKAFLALLVRFSRATERLSLHMPCSFQASARFGSRLDARPDAYLDASPAKLVFQNVSAQYGDELPVFSNVSFDLEENEIAVLSQPSGFGKTTLLRVAAGLMKSSQGSVNWGFSGSRVSCAVMFQQPVLIESLSAQANVELFCGSARTKDAYREMLLHLLPPAALVCPVSQLSGGQRRRVELCRAMAHPSKYVLLDEPFAALDAQTAQLCAQFVRTHASGRCVLVASHSSVLQDEQNGQVIRQDGKSGRDEQGGQAARQDEQGGQSGRCRMLTF